MHSDSPVFHESCVLRFEGHDPRRIPACVSDLGKKRKAHKRFFFVHAVRSASFSFDTSSALSKVKRITTARKSTSKATCILSTSVGTVDTNEKNCIAAHRKLVCILSCNNLRHCSFWGRNGRGQPKKSTSRRHSAECGVRSTRIVITVS